MVMCDGVWVEPVTGKPSLLGCFSTIQSANFPLVLPQVAVFTQLSSLRGRQILRLRIVDADEARPCVYEFGREVDSIDPLRVAEIVWPIGNVVCAEPGEYRIQLWAGTHLLQERRLDVQQLARSA